MKSIPNLRRPLMVAALALLTTAGVAQGHADVEDSGFKRNTAGTVKVHIQHGGCRGNGGRSRRCARAEGLPVGDAEARDGLACRHEEDS